MSILSIGSTILRPPMRISFKSPAKQNSLATKTMLNKISLIKHSFNIRTGRQVDIRA